MRHYVISSGLKMCLGVTIRYEIYEMFHEDYVMLTYMASNTVPLRLHDPLQKRLSTVR